MDVRLVLALLVVAVLVLFYLQYAQSAKGGSVEAVQKDVSLMYKKDLEDLRKEVASKNEEFKQAVKDDVNARLAALGVQSVPQIQEDIQKAVIQHIASI